MQTKPSTIQNVLTVDVEDYFQVEAFAHLISRDDWPQFESRVRRNTERVLDLFARHQCHGTFFVLGWVAEREPSLVRAIADAGHEVACHSYFHKRVSSFTPGQFRADLCQAKQLIEDACGHQVAGFRAPTFSIVAHSLWALDILLDEGFTYDASIFPVHHDLYGIPDAPRFPYVRQTPSGRSIVEVPPSTTSLFGNNVGIGGGGYLRLLPLSVTRWGIDRLHAAGQPAVVYFHPWEIDAAQPRIESAGLRSRLRHYSGLSRMESKIDALLTRYRFGTMLDLVSRIAPISTATTAS